MICSGSETRTDSLPSVAVSVDVVIPYLDRAEHLKQAVAAWLAQTYAGKLTVHVVDFSGVYQPPPGAVVVRAVNRRWNICRARNLGARASRGDLLIFGLADLIVIPTFVAEIVSQWDAFDVWLAEGVVRGVPHNPSVESLLAVKRWVNTRIRGFNEPMMEDPRGWGYDAIDYRLRALQMLVTSGGTYGEFSTESVQVLLHPEEWRVRPYDVKDLGMTYSQHGIYSKWYREEHGYVANKGRVWGDP